MAWMLPQLGRVTLNTAKVPAQMEKQRRRERLEEEMKESGASGNNSLMARVLAQVKGLPTFQSSRLAQKKLMIHCINILFQELRLRNRRRARRLDIAMMNLVIRFQQGCRVIAESYFLGQLAGFTITAYMLCMSLEHEYTRCHPTAPHCAAG